MQDRTGDDCIVVGGGPAGMMLAYLLARDGVRVTLFEKRDDLRKSFRGDIIHPSTLQIMSDLGWIDEFLKIPHGVSDRMWHYGMDHAHPIADFRKLKCDWPYAVSMRQWQLLEFIARKAADLPNLTIRFGHRITGLIHENGQCLGVKWCRGGTHSGEAHAPLTIGADGRDSIVRYDSGFEVMDFGSDVDVVWFRIPRLPDDPKVMIQNIDERYGITFYDRGDTWRCGLIIKKGSFPAMKAAGLPEFRKTVSPLLPFPAERLAALNDWQQVGLMAVKVDRLVRWWAPGVLCIGDAAHAMSPAGGVGMNLAIQDAVAAARILAAPLRERRLTEDDLAMVEARRLYPTRATQILQRLLRVRPGRDGCVPDRSSHLVRLLYRFPFLRHVTGWMIGLGFRPERLGRDIVSEADMGGGNLHA